MTNSTKPTVLEGKNHIKHPFERGRRRERENVRGMFPDEGKNQETAGSNAPSGLEPKNRGKIAS